MIELIPLEDTIQPLSDHFNTQTGRVRLLAFVSPT